jgi:hypothetical protein
VVELAGSEPEAELLCSLLRSADIESLSRRDTYQWYCPIAGHARLGMKGTITVR